MIAGPSTEKAPIKRAAVALWVLTATVLCLTWGCSEVSNPETKEEPTREGSIPDGAVKMTPEMDVWPPVTHSAEWDQPVPMEGPVNTAGAEDAPVITPDGKTFIFFFTPDVTVPAEKQILDGVTGVWWCTLGDSAWNEPERAVLADPGALAMDGPFCIEGNTLWFCSARVGNYRELDIYTAKLIEGTWSNWQNAGHLLNVEYWVGELYTTADRNTMYYDSNRDGGHGGKDIWETVKVEGQWTEPVNLGQKVNTDLDEGWLYVTADGAELWFTRWSGLGYVGPALFRSVKAQDGTWGEPEEIISNFAGDPALDAAGNVYFTHHFYSEDMEMIEADIYVAYRR
jgi:hypothetical protein